MPVVEEQHGLDGPHQHQVLMPGVAQIREQGAGGVVEDVQPGLFRDVPEAAAAIIFIEAVGHAALLADVDLVGAIIVDVGHRDPVLAVNIQAAVDCSAHHRPDGGIHPRGVSAGGHYTDACDSGHMLLVVGFICGLVDRWTGGQVNRCKGNLHTLLSPSD